jgi:hypothetical protein
LFSRPECTEPSPCSAHSDTNYLCKNGVRVQRRGDELDPRRFDFRTVDPNRVYNQLYASIKAAGKFQLVLTPADADLVLQARFSHSVTALEFHIKLAILDPRSNVLLWAFSETVPAATGPHWKEKREDNFNEALTKLLNEFTSLCNGGKSTGL